MFIVGKSFFSENLFKFNIKTIAPLRVIHIPLKILRIQGYTTFGVSKACQNQQQQKKILPNS